MGFFTNNSAKLSLVGMKWKPPKTVKDRKEVPENEEVRILYRIADSARDRAILCMAYQNGLAPVDISKLIIGDLPLEDSEVKEWSYYTKARSKTSEVWFGVITPELSHNLNDVLFALPKPLHTKAKLSTEQPKFSDINISNLTDRLKSVQG